MHLRGLILSLFGLILLVPAAASAATPDGVIVEINPTAIQVGAGDHVQVLLQVRNNTASVVQNVQLHWISDLNLTVVPDGDGTHIIKPHASSVWPVTISQKIASRSVGKLTFWATYVTGDSADSTVGVSVASLDIGERAGLDANRLVTLKLESAVDHFDEKHEAYFYLIVTNTSSIPITVKAIHADSPSFIRLQAGPAGDATIPPSASKTFTVVAFATDKTPTGTQRIILNADLAWFDGGTPQTATISVAQTLPVSVLGESDLLKLIGVPSFLFLPGFLALAAFTALWSRTREEGYPQLTLSVAETAVAAVTLSFFSAILYPLFPPHRDYLSGYGLRDVFWVWMGSILLGGLAWVVVFATISVRRRMEAERRKREAVRLAEANEARMSQLTPTKNDGPLEMLARMQLINLSPPPEQALVSFAGTPKIRAFVLVPSGAPQTAPNSPTWVGPPISLTPNSTIADGWSRSKLIAMLQAEGVLKDYHSLAVLLANAQSAGWNVDWGDSGAVIGPTPVQPTAFEKVEPVQGFSLVQL